MDDFDSEPKVEVVGDDEMNLTFVLRNEDHTIGNSLRYVLVRNPDVKFCGYSIPHPSENILKIRVETYSKPAAFVFRQALQDLRAIADHMRTIYNAELESFMAMQNDK